MYRSIFNNDDISNNIYMSRNNINTLNSLNSMEDLSKSKYSRKNYIKKDNSSSSTYNTYRKRRNFMSINRYNSNSIKKIFDKKDEIFKANLPNIISDPDKRKIHFF